MQIVAKLLRGIHLNASSPTASSLPAKRRNEAVPGPSRSPIDPPGQTDTMAVKIERISTEWRCSD